MSVAIAEQCDDEPGVNEDVSCHSPSPARNAFLRAEIGRQAV
jgi:hypothetical protein